MARTSARAAAWTPPEDVAPVAPAWLRERRLALWGLLLAKLVAGWGVQWDIRWHVLVGRDSFWIPPHLMTYAGVTLAVLLSFGILARETWRARIAGTAPPGTVPLLGLSGTPGFHLAAWGIALTVLAAPIDDLWHRLFGLDVTLWSPPHLLGLLGAAVNTLACYRIAHEIYPPASRLRLVALVATGALLYATLHFAVEPSARIAYVYGGVRFHTYAILSALLMPGALLSVTRLCGWRAAPVLVLLALGGVGLAGRQIEQAGFGWLEPASVIADEITRNPRSPIAIAHEIARKNGTPPGRPAATLPLLLLVPGAVMAAVDARRRPVLATVGYAVALFAVVGTLLATRPAFRPLVPGAGTTTLALGFTVLAALMGGVTGRWLAERLGRDPA